MISRRCADLAELRSAYVDGALSDHARERLLRHLVDCASCRQDIAELRDVRALLSRDVAPVDAPGDLAARLRAIGETPTQRRRSRIVRATVAGVTVGAVATGLALVGYTAAPAAPDVVSDPVGTGRAAYTAALGRLPLGGDAVGAVDLSGAAGGAAPGVKGEVDPPVAHGRALSPGAARGVLQRAADAEGSVSYQGLQSFRAYRDGSVMAAEIGVQAQATQGRAVQVLSLQGEELLSGFAPNEIPSRMVDDELLDLIDRNYRIEGWHGPSVAGRETYLITAGRSGQVAARWWVDQRTGLVLWQQTYDERGALAVSFGFTSLTMSGHDSWMEHFPPRLAVSGTTVSLGLTDAPRLTASGWFCRAEIGGLSLIRLRVDRRGQPSTVHLFLSDGVTTASVVEQRGRLVEPLAGATLDPGLRAYLTPGAARAATWQSGGQVFTVVTDGSAEQLAGVVRALPHAPPAAATTMGAVGAGWAKILADVKG